MKRTSGLLKVPIGALVWYYILFFWQSRQVDSQLQTWDNMSHQTKYSWDCKKICSLNEGGLYGVGLDKTVPQYKILSLKDTGNCFIFKEVLAKTSGNVVSDFCCSEITWWIRILVTAVAMLMHDNVTATVFCYLLTLCMLVVYWEKKSRYLISHGVYLCMLLFIAWVRGLWLVNTTKWLPSSLHTLMYITVKNSHQHLPIAVKSNL